jgi:hypothetical protein
MGYECNIAYRRQLYAFCSLFIEIKTGTVAIIKFWTSFFCHIKKITLNHALLKLSHMNDEIVVKFIYKLST